MKYTEELDKVSYCFGLSIASNLLSSGVNTIKQKLLLTLSEQVCAGQMPNPNRKRANLDFAGLF